MKNTIVKDALILFVITAVAGVLLAFVNELTKVPIARQKEEAVNEACRTVLPEADEFVPVELDADISEWSEYYSRNSVEAIYQAKRNGEAAGYVLNMSSREGYGGVIRFSLGIKPDSTIGGVAILETHETPGLGLNAEDVLLPQFKDKNVGYFVYVKGGATKNEEIDAISSATITTNAFVNGVNSGLDYYWMYLMR